MSVRGGRVGTTKEKMRRRKKRKGTKRGSVDIQDRVGQSKHPAAIHFSTLAIRYSITIIM